MKTFGAWRWNSTLRTLELSAALAQLCGAGAPTVLSAGDLSQLFTEDSVSTLMHAFDVCLHQQRPLEAELRARHSALVLQMTALAPLPGASVIDGIAERLVPPADAGAGSSAFPPALPDHLPLGVLTVTAGLVLRHANQTARRWLNLSAGDDWQSFLSSPAGQTVAATVSDYFSRHATAAVCSQLPCGEPPRYLRISASDIPDVPVVAGNAGGDAGNCRECLILLEDISDIRRLEQEIRTTEQRWQLALESSGDGVWDWNPQTGVEYLSDRLKAIYGYGPDDIDDIADELDGRTHPDDIEQMQADRQAHFDGLTPTYVNEHRVQCKNGKWKWILTRGIVIERDQLGQVTRIVGTHTDISEKRAAETALRESEERLRMALSATHQGLYDLDLKTGRAVVNEEYANMLGYAHADFVETSENWQLRVHPDDFQASEQAFLDYLNGKADEYRVEFRQKHADGSWVWILSVGAMVEWDDAGNPIRMLGTILNITDKKHSEALIWQQANIDPLTGLPNRRMFYDRLELDLRRSRRNHTLLAVLFIDLDYFKEVNDTLGHATGDALLIEAARRLLNCVREADMVARLGGDEFTIALTDFSDTGPVEKIARHIIEQLTQPYRIGLEEIYLSASIGITFYPRDAENLEDLIKHADQAMYAAKDGGRNRFAYFTPELQTAALGRLRLGNELRTAISEHHLQVWFQPVIDLNNGEIKKAEALIRWKHEQLGWISPAEFIPIAESSGLISQIGDLVFRQAAHWGRHWRQASHASFQISLNQSPVEFQSDKNRYQEWTAYLHELGLPGQAIVIEITEGLLLDAHKTVTEQLLIFRDAGIQVAIDDFGTGYSSLSYLKKFDIDYLKIDRSFIHNLSKTSSDMALCEAIIMMAHKLGLKVIAEGVETAEQAELLRSVHCDYAQGYLFSRPLPPEEFDQLLRDHSAGRTDFFQQLRG